MSAVWTRRALLAVALTSPAAFAQEVDVELLSDMEARSIGPAGMSGRIGAIDAVASDPRIVYVGAATGGLWKSVDAGLTWDPIFDEQPVHAIGALAIHPEVPDVVWVGTGEGVTRNSVSVGAGVYRTVDGGESFDFVGLEATERIAKIVVHPEDPDTAWVAAVGELWGENPERGVFKTTDGGANWQHVLSIDERTGCADLVIDPSNPDKLFASMWDYRRWPHSFRSGGPGSGLYLTRDGGASWDEITSDQGLPRGELGRIGLAIAPSDPDFVYAIVESETNGIYASEDGGKSFERRTTEGPFGNRPFYYSQLRVDPQYPQRVYSLWSSVSVSDDGGRNWRTIVPFREVHPDHHALWVNPHDPMHLINGNDGGVAISRDRGLTWRFVANLPLAQYYHIAADDEVPYNVYGGMQDNGSWRGPNTVWENGGIRNHHWHEVGFGDGFATVPLRGDARQGFSMSQEGYLMRWDLRTGQRKSVRPWGPDGIPLRFNWDAPICLDPFDDDTLYYGSQFVHKSTDRGESWDLISGDLTTNNPEWQKQAESGGLTLDVTGAENYTTCKAIGASPLSQGEIWVGTDDGRVWLTRDGGQGWTNLDGKFPGLPANTWVSHVEPSRHSAGHCYITFDDHRRSNKEVYVYATEDFGQSWRNLATDDVSGYALTIVQDPIQEKLLFLGTEWGLYVSVDAGASWMHWTHGFPHSASVMGLTIQEREADLVIGTHGRAAWVLDDIRPLREIAEGALDEALHLYLAPDAQQYIVAQTGASRFPGHGEFRGQGQRYGAMISYSVNPAEDAELELKLEIVNAAGEVVWSDEPSAERGLHRVSWNLRERIPGEGGGGRRFGGPEALPGLYTVRLSDGERELTTPLRVLEDPRVPVARADREAKRAMLARAQELQEEVSGVEDEMRKLRSSLTRLKAVVEENAEEEGTEESAEESAEGGESAESAEAATESEPSAHQRIGEKCDAILEQLDELEEWMSGQDRSAQGITAGSEFRDRLGGFRRAAGSSWEAPNETERILQRQAEDAVRDLLDRFNPIAREQMGELRALLDEVELDLLPDVSTRSLDG